MLIFLKFAAKTVTVLKIVVLVFLITYFIPFIEKPVKNNTNIDLMSSFYYVQIVNVREYIAYPVDALIHKAAPKYKNTPLATGIVFLLFLLVNSGLNSLYEMLIKSQKTIRYRKERVTDVGVQTALVSKNAHKISSEPNPSPDSTISQNMNETENTPPKFSNRFIKKAKEYIFEACVLICTWALVYIAQKLWHIEF